MDQANFPLANALATGHDTLEKGARCYVRYKLYDKGKQDLGYVGHCDITSVSQFPICMFCFCVLAAVLSKVTKMADSDGILTSELGHKHTLNIPASSPFRW